jgi:hypothetical protein
MMEWAAGIVALPVGWVIKKQLEYNAQTAENKKDIAGMKSDVEYVRSRVDELCNHLIESKRNRY